MDVPTTIATVVILCTPILIILTFISPKIGLFWLPSKLKKRKFFFFNLLISFALILIMGLVHAVPNLPEANAPVKQSEAIVKQSEASVLATQPEAATHTNAITIDTFIGLLALLSAPTLIILTLISPKIGLFWVPNNFRKRKFFFFNLLISFAFLLIFGLTHTVTNQPEAATPTNAITINTFIALLALLSAPTLVVLTFISPKIGLFWMPDSFRKRKFFFFNILLSFLFLIIVPLAHHLAKRPEQNLASTFFSIIFFATIPLAILSSIWPKIGLFWAPRELRGKKFFYLYILIYFVMLISYISIFTAFKETPAGMILDIKPVYMAAVIILNICLVLFLISFFWPHIGLFYLHKRFKTRKHSTYYLLIISAIAVMFSLGAAVKITGSYKFLNIYSRYLNAPQYRIFRSY